MRCDATRREEKARREDIGTNQADQYCTGFSSVLAFLFDFFQHFFSFLFLQCNALKRLLLGLLRIVRIDVGYIYMHRERFTLWRPRQRAQEREDRHVTVTPGALSVGQTVSIWAVKTWHGKKKKIKSTTTYTQISWVKGRERENNKKGKKKKKKKKETTERPSVDRSRQGNTYTQQQHTKKRERDR